MSNGIATNLLVTAALAFALGGCDRGPSQPAGRISWQLTRDGVVSVDGQAQIALPAWLWVKAPYACPPALATGPRGEAVVTSNVMPTLWRIDPQTLAVTTHPLTLDADAGKDVGFSGLVYSAEHAAYFAVSEPHGSLWKIDAQLSYAQKVPLSQPISGACGLTVPPRPAPAAKTLRAARLCTESPEGRWSIDFAPDQRSAYARSAHGQDCPWSPANVALQGD